jgi:hypothetical protein
MSINLSYFSKNNTLISESYTNTGRNPITELYFGSAIDTFAPAGYSRFIFDLDLNLLTEKYNNGTISTECSSAITHTLRMINTSSFDINTLNEHTTTGRLRATSFDLVLFRIPLSSGQTGNPQYWDEGVGYDYVYGNKTINTSRGSAIPNFIPDDKSFSYRPSNWYQTTTISGWSTNGMYKNTTGGTVNYSDLVILDTQHFEFGNEDIEFDMTNEINSILDGTLTNVSGWGIAYLPEVENITGFTENYSVGFFTRHTQTFYEPYLLTNYDDIISDDRNLFVQNKDNKLYLYVYDNGLPVNLDVNPTVTIKDNNDDPLLGLVGLSTCLKTKGVYEVTIPSITGYSSPCQFNDVWGGLVLNGVGLPDITNEFVLYPYSSSIQIGIDSKEPSLFGFDFYGIKQDEKILNTDVRKVGVVIKKAYTPQQPLQKIDSYYRIYVREGQTEVQVQDWTRINKTSNEYYFIFDTRDKIPNEYYIDIKVNTSGQVDTYKRTLKFQIVNKK